MGTSIRALCALAAAASLVAAGCGDDGNEADRRGVGATCTTAEDCFEMDQSCLEQFKGGYCGVEGCNSSEDCPAGSACVAHTDGSNYCFRLCVDKPECNRHRDEANESNCSSSVDYVDAETTGKACVPPSG